MKALVCGAGEVGFNIARQLVSEDHDVVVIDHAQERIQKVSEDLDVQSIFGFASHPDVLERAGADEADMLIAVTQSDEINIVACQVAHSLFTVPTKIARIRHQAYLAPGWGDLFTRDHMPIDHIISPETEVVRSINRRLALPGALDMAGFADDRVRLVGARLDGNCPVVNTPLRQLKALAPGLDMTITCIVRGEHTLYPSGAEVLMEGDEVYFVADTEKLPQIMPMLGHEETAARHVLIIGGGNIGLLLAQELERLNPDINLKLIESDRSRAALAADTLENTVVLHGNALDTDLLDEANIAGVETVIAVTDNDEVNVLASVLAKRHGCLRTLTLINSAAYVPLVSPLGIDASVSPRALTVSRILQHVRQGRIRSVYTLRSGDAEMIEIEARETADIVGRPLRDVNMPHGALVAALVRKNTVLMPRGNITVEPNDIAVVFSPREGVKKVQRMFAVAVGFF